MPRKYLFLLLWFNLDKLKHLGRRKCDLESLKPKCCKCLLLLYYVIVKQEKLNSWFKFAIKFELIIKTRILLSLFFSPKKINYGRQLAQEDTANSWL